MISFDLIKLIVADGHKDGRALSRKIKFITLLLYKETGRLRLVSLSFNPIQQWAYLDLHQGCPKCGHASIEL